MPCSLKFYIVSKNKKARCTFLALNIFKTDVLFLAWEIQNQAVHDI